jgi:hypothetical protein
MQRRPIVTAVIARDGFGSVPLAVLRAFVIYAMTAGSTSFTVVAVADHVAGAFLAGPARAAF